MLLSPGACLGPYEVLGPVGAGGMGEVYRARDTRLDRDVALKILPERVAGHPEALSRFEREAKAVAALSHPNILAIHDYGRDGDVTYVVMELLDGESLRAALANGALPARKAVDYAVQVAHGIAAAHEKGIVHRDLKPDNLFVTRDGRVKVLDFGLATREPLPEQDSTGSPTLSRHTDPGVALGTVGYMSPEQVRGAHVDHRSDIFALGCVLYEMLAGRRAFARANAPETMSAILRDDIPEWPETGRHVPEALDRLVRRCLEKKPEERLQSARDLALALELVAGDRLSGGTSRLFPGSLGARTRLSAAIVLVALASALASGVVAWRVASGRSRPSKPVRFTIEVESSGPRGSETVGVGGVAVGTIAVCPDGTCIVFRATAQSEGRLLLRALDRNTPTPLPGTEGGYGPFFSPDGQWLGFFADGRLKKIAVEKLSVQTLCEAREGFGASWDAERGIFFGAGRTGPLLRVPAVGGQPEAVTRLEEVAGETSHRWPAVLPGGAGLVYESVDVSGQGQIVAESLRTGERKVLFAGSCPHFAASGHVLYTAGDAVRAVPFDPDHLRVAGPPIEVIERSPGAGQFDVSLNGTLAFVTRKRLPSGDRMLMRVDRSGHATPLADVRRAFRWPRFSPDGHRLAVSIRDAGRDDIWVYDLSRRALTRLTVSGRNAGAIWHPDGQRVTYRSDRAGPWNLFEEPIDGGGPVERLTTSAFAQFPSSWSPDGRLLSFGQVDPATGNDIWVLSASGEKSPTPFANSAFGEWDGFFSPDGRALVYTSTESGRLEVYVRPYPGPGGRRQVSTDGGNSPVWARTGKELFYLNGDRLMTASIRTAPQIAVGAPSLLFEGEYDFAGIVPNHDVTPDGTAFVMLRGERREPWQQINVVLNWFEELRETTDRDGPES
jgi:eukaryotic-like serine/threonine-protein kinase